MYELNPEIIHVFKHEAMNTLTHICELFLNIFKMPEERLNDSFESKWITKRNNKKTWNDKYRILFLVP